MNRRIKDRAVMSRKMNDHNDNADISSNGWEFEELIAVIHSLPDVRNDKIQWVRRCIESGTYRIDSGKIAERILEEGFSIVDKEISKPGISPSWTSRIACLPSRFSKLGLPAILRKGAGDHRDMTDVSSEARKKQILSHAKSEVIKSIRRTK